MGILDRFFGGKSKASAPAQTQGGMQAECSHLALMGRWDSVTDMGQEDKITEFICDSCHMSFTPEEGRQLRETTSARLNTDEIERARQRVEARDAGASRE